MIRREEGRRIEYTRILFASKAVFGFGQEIAAKHERIWWAIRVADEQCLQFIHDLLNFD